MSVITNTQAVPCRLRSIFRFLLANKSDLSATEVEKLFSPPSLARGPGGGDEDERGSTLFPNALKEAIELGLVVKADAGGGRDSRLKLAETWVTRCKENADECFRQAIEEILLDPNAPERHGQFAKALTWFLMQDPTRPLEWRDENPKSRIEKEVGDATGFGVSSNATFQEFVYWAQYLGFAVRVGRKGSAGSVFPDPSAAIIRHLDIVFGDRTRLGMREFLEGLARRLPVLEYGQWRNFIEGASKEAYKREPNALSRATSLALRRLEKRGFIKLQLMSDADKHILAWPKPEGCSHIDKIRTMA